MTDQKQNSAGKLDALQAQLEAKYPDTILCNLPDAEFEFGGLVHAITTGSGHHSGRATVGGLGLWSLPTHKLLKTLR
jgi:hypothetical protein